MSTGWIIRDHLPEPGDPSEAALKTYWQEADRIALAILARTADQAETAQPVRTKPPGPAHRRWDGVPPASNRSP